MVDQQHAPLFSVSRDFGPEKRQELELILAKARTLGFVVLDESMIVEDTDDGGSVIAPKAVSHSAPSRGKSRNPFTRFFGWLLGS